MDTVGHGEMAEKQLDAMIRRRHDKRKATEGERAVEEAWMESERLYRGRLRAENRAAWREYHRGQAARLRRNLAALVAHHEAEAEKLAREEAC